MLKVARVVRSCYLCLTLPNKVKGIISEKQINEMLKKSYVTIRITDDLKKQLKELAVKDKRKPSDYIRLALERHIELINQ